MILNKCINAISVILNSACLGCYFRHVEAQWDLFRSRSNFQYQGLVIDLQHILRVRSYFVDSSCFKNERKQNIFREFLGF